VTADDQQALAMNPRQALAFSRPLARATGEIGWARRVERVYSPDGLLVTILTVNR